jgi:uncharacterized protein YbaR (Trm112 family)
MPAESTKNLNAFEAWASDLACPVCQGVLRLEEAAVRCIACGRVYPIVDGIPVLIAERSKQEI